MVGPAKDWFSDHSNKKTPNCACHFCSGATLLKNSICSCHPCARATQVLSVLPKKRKTRIRQSFLYHSKLDYTSRSARVIQAVQVSFKLCLSPCAGAKTHVDTCVPPCAKAVPISVSFKSDYTSRFVHGRRASILILESIRNRQAECHLESRVIPALPHTPTLRGAPLVATAARKSAPESGA